MRIQLIAASAIAVAALSTPAWAQPSGNSSANWTTAGPVFAVARSGSTVYLGGQFNSIAPKSQQIGAFGVFANVVGRRSCTLPPISGTVAAIAPDGSGGYFVGGRFDRVGTTDRLNLAHITSGCAVDTAWTGIVRGRVNALSASAGVLYVGGAFSDAGQQGGGTGPRANLAAFSTTSGVLQAWDPGANGEVSALEAATFTVSGSSVTHIYAGGVFTQLAGVPRLRLGAIDGAGVVTTFIADADGAVLALDLDPFGLTPSRIWIGGDFSSVAGTARNRLASVVISTNIVDPSFDPNANGTVRSIVVVGTAISNATIFVGGDFSSIGGAANKNYLAAVSPAGLALSFNPDPDGPVYAVVADTPSATVTIYAGGRFTRLGGATRLNAGRVSSTTGAALDWNPAFNGEVRAISTAGFLARVACGGDFNAVSAQRRRNLAAINIDNGQLLGFAPNLNGGVNTLALRNDVLYVGGEFTRVDSTTRNRLASFAPITRALTTWDPNVGSSVTALVAGGSTIYVGGNFDNIGSTPRVRLAAVDPVSGAVNTTFAPPDFNAVVATLELQSSLLYVGGLFTSVGGVPTNYLTRVNATDGARDLTWLPSPNGEVRALCGQPAAMYVGGLFTMMGTSARANLAAVDLTTGLASGWQPDPNGFVNTLSCTAQIVYAGGNFTTIGSGASQQTRPRLAGLLPAATGATATYATSFRARAVGVLQDLRLASDGLLAGANSEPFTDEDEPVARFAFFAENFVGAPGAPLTPSVFMSGPGPGFNTVATRFRWSPPTRGPRPTSYRIEAGSTPGSTSYTGGLTTTDTQFDITAPGGLPVFLRIRAVNGFGVSAPSDELQFSTTISCSGPPDPPTDLGFTLSGSDATFAWAPGSGELSNPYRFEAGLASGRADFVFTANGTSFTGTAPPGTYFARVRGVGVCGTSLPSSEAIILIGGASAPPTPPVNFNAVVTSPNAVTVSWGSPASGTATSYRLEAGSGFRLSDIASFTTALTSLSFTNVPSGTYYLRIYAIGPSGTSAPSDEFIFVVP